MTVPTTTTEAPGSRETPVGNKFAAQHLERMINRAERIQLDRCSPDVNYYLQQAVKNLEEALMVAQIAAANF